jgi:hypothetical protein
VCSSDLNDFLKEIGESPTRSRDAEEVADERDHDEEGTPDISYETHAKENEKIKKDLDKIDADGNAVPDYMETHEYESPKQEAFIKEKIDSAINDLDKEDADKIRVHKKVDEAEEVAEKTFGSKAGKAVRDIKDLLTRKHEIQAETKRLIEGVGSEKEKMELRKKPEDIDLSLLSDQTLREMAIRYREPFVIFGSENPFKDELLNRMKRREAITIAEKKLDVELDFKREQLEEELKKKRLEFRKELKR